MTVTARTATLIINTKHAQFDSLLRAKYASDEGAKAPERVNFLADIGLLVYPEALRWASERAFKIGTTNNVLYVPENEWTQVLAALDKLYATVKAADTPWKMANVQPLLITSLMPLGFRGAAPALPAPSGVQWTVDRNNPNQVIYGDGRIGLRTDVDPSWAPVGVQTYGAVIQDPRAVSEVAGGANLQQAMEDASTPVTTREDNVITLPVATNTGNLPGVRSPLVVAIEAALREQGVRGDIDQRCLDMLPNSITEGTAADIVSGPRGLQNAEFRACLERGGATFGMDPKLKMVGFAAAGLLGAFLLVKLAK